MPLQFTIVLPDDATHGVLVDETRKQWLVLHVRSADSQMSLAKRAGMTYRTLRHYMDKYGLTLESLLRLKRGGLMIEADSAGGGWIPSRDSRCGALPVLRLTGSHPFTSRRQSV